MALCLLIKANANSVHKAVFLNDKNKEDHF